MKKRKYLRLIKRLSALALVVFLLAFGSSGDIYTNCAEPSVAIDHDENRMFLDYADVVEMVRQVCNQQAAIPVVETSLSQIEERINAHPAVKNADVWFGVGGNLHIRISQRHPIALIENLKGEKCYLDRDGYTFPADIGQPARVVFANGFIHCAPSGDHISRNPGLNAVYSLASELHRQEFWNAWIEQVWVEPDTQMIMIPKWGKHEIRMGHPEHINGKLNKLSIFYRHALSADGWKSYRVLDARFRGQVIAITDKKSQEPVLLPDTLAL